MPAEPTETEAAESWAHRYGVGISAGGGVSDWFSGPLRSLTGTSGTWDVRLMIGLNKQIGAEATYVGRASSLETPFNISNSTTLYGNGAEVLGRLNILPATDFTPFVFLGVGWMRLKTTTTLVFADTGVSDNTDILQFPLGGGVDWKAPFGLLVDARFAFRPTTNGDLVLNNQTTVINGQTVIVGGPFLNMDSWEFNANVGYQF